MPKEQRRAREKETYEKWVSECQFEDRVKDGVSQKMGELTNEE